jgi:hypothetical protein
MHLHLIGLEMRAVEHADAMGWGCQLDLKIRCAVVVGVHPDLDRVTVPSGF